MKNDNLQFTIYNLQANLCSDSQLQCQALGKEAKDEIASAIYIHLRQTIFPICLGNVAFPQEELEGLSEENDIYAAFLTLNSC